MWQCMNQTGSVHQWDTHRSLLKTRGQQSAANTCMEMHWWKGIAMHNDLDEAGSGGGLCRMLQRTDWFTQEKAATLLTAILAARPNQGTAETPLPPLVMNGASSSSGHHAAPPPVPTPTAESEAVQNILVTFVDWLTSQLRCGTGWPLATTDDIGQNILKIMKSSSRVSHAVSPMIAPMYLVVPVPKCCLKPGPVTVRHLVQKGNMLIDNRYLVHRFGSQKQGC